MKKITAKLGTMRQAVEWVVYPRKDGDKGVVIQSDKRICMFDPETGKGILSKHCASGAYFLHLNKALGAGLCEVPREVIDAAIDAMPKSGDVVGPGVVLA